MNTDFKSIINLLQDNIKFFFKCTLIAAFIGFIYLLFITPKYDVSVIVSENDEEARVGLDSGGIVSSLVGGSSKKRQFINEFNETIFSLDVTKRLDEDKDLLFTIFKDFYNEETASYNQIVNLDSILKKVKFWFYGVNYQLIPNHFLLRDYLQGNISVVYDEYSGLITVSSLSSQPFLAQEIIRDLLKETDNAFKELDRSETDAKIEYLYSEISKNKEINQIAAISNILQNELLKKSLINSRADYKFKTVRGLEMSEYPVYPNFMFILMLFIFFGLFGSIAYKLFLFVLKDF